MYEAQIIPACFTVNESCDVRVEITADRELSEGTQFEVQFPQSWTMDGCASFTKEYQTEAPDAPEYLRVDVAGQNCRFDVWVEERDPDTGTDTTRHGRRIFALLTQGTIPAGAAVTFEWRNTLSSRLAETELVHVAVDGDRVQPMPQIITYPAGEDRLRVIAPSAVAPAEEFDVLIVSLDACDNISRALHDGEALLDAHGEPLTKPLQFHGSCRVSVALHDKGIRRLQYRDVLSNPIRVTENPTGPYWGDIHIHTRWSGDAIGRFPYEYARDVSGLDFAAVCDHANTAAMHWDTLMEKAGDHNEPGEFVTLVAYENGLGAPSGHHNTYYRGDSGDCYLKSEFDGDIEKLNAMTDPENVMNIPHHTAIAWGNSLPGTTVDFDRLDLQYSPVLEIYSHHGQSERYMPDHVNAYEFNRWHKPGGRTNRSVPGHFAQDAWQKGKRIGVIASCDDHFGQGGKDFEGCAAVFADELTRNKIWHSIRNRRCYGTTGLRILMDLQVNGVGMGNELTAEPGEPLTIDIQVHGTDNLSIVQLVRLDIDREEYTNALNERPYELDFQTTIEETFEGPVMYYLRVQQEKMIRHRAVMGWSSPIWIDEG